MKPMLIRTQPQKPSLANPYTESKSISIEHTGTKWTSATLIITKSSYSLYWNQVKSDSRHWTAVNFDHPQKHQVHSDDCTQIQPVWASLKQQAKGPPTRANQANRPLPFFAWTLKSSKDWFHDETMTILIHTLKPSNYGSARNSIIFNRYSKQLYFELNSKTKSILISCTKIS